MRIATPVRRWVCLASALLLPLLPAPAAADASGPVPAPATATAEPAAGAARVVAERRVGDRMWDVAIESPALGATVTTRLLVPRGWHPGTRRTWPVLYLLHGCCEREGHTSWTRNTDVEEQFADVDALVVMPPAGWAGFYSDWANHGLGGPPKWETFHLTELRGILEQRYGAGRHRAIAGLSMGGFGALSYAARHPGMFRAAASYSGVAHTLYSPPRGPRLVQGVVASGGEDPNALWGDPVLDRDTWEAHNPYDLAPMLRGTDLYVACGDGTPGEFDEPTAAVDPVEQLLHEENHALVRRLEELDVPATVRLDQPGTHSWPYWERELRRSLPLLLDALGERGPRTR